MERMATVLMSMAVAIAAGCATASAEKGAAPVVRSKKATGKIVIDGRLDEAAWKDAAEVRLRSADGKADAGRETRVKVCHDEKNLYLAFACQDPDIWTDHRGRDGHMWTEDVVECFIDVDPADPAYVELEVNPTGDLFDGFFLRHRRDVLMAWNPDIEVKVSVDGTVNKRDDVDRSWTVEMAIPVGDLAAAPAVGKPGADTRPRTTWGINFYRNERSGQTGELQAWAPVQGDFHATWLFGKIQFE